MSWSYGLVEDEGRIVLAEVYKLDEDDKVTFYYPLTISDVNDEDFDSNLVIDDLHSQFKNFRVLKESDFFE